MKQSIPQTKGGSLWHKTQHANLYRYNPPSGSYYALARIKGKRIRRCLNTRSLDVAVRRLNDLTKEEREKADRLSSHPGKVALFGQLLEEIKQNGYRPLRARNAKDRIKLKPRSLSYYDERRIALYKSWAELEHTRVNKLTLEDFETWSAGVRNTYGREWSGSSFNHTLSLIRWTLDLAEQRSMVHHNVAKLLVRKTEKPKKPILPTPAQFAQLVRRIETSGSGKSRPCANLVRFLAYGGFRVHSEARWITWADCDFDKREILVKGDPVTGTKGTDSIARRVPMIPEMRELLLKLRDRRQTQIQDETELARTPVMEVFECQKALDRACRKLNIPRLTHHDMRDVFGTQCIEAGVPIPTVAKWLGHKDGGALLMRTYAHLRDTHSAEMAKRVSFAVTKPENVVQLEMAV